MKKRRLCAILILLALFCALTMCIFTDGIAPFESSIYAEITPFITPSNTNVVIFITNLGSFAAVASLLALLVLFPVTRFSFGIPATLNAVLAAALNLFLKNVIARERPSILRLVFETGYGFPSGHAMNNAALYAMLVLLVFHRTKNKKMRASALLLGLFLTVSIGISRIYLGVHNPSDVLAGWVMGVAVALFTDGIWLQMLLQKNKA